MNRLIERLKKFTAGTTAAALILTAPGLPMYAAAEQAITTPVAAEGPNGGAIAVSPIIPGGAGIDAGGRSGGVLRRGGIGNAAFSHKTGAVSDAAADGTISNVPDADGIPLIEKERDAEGGVRIDGSETSAQDDAILTRPSSIQGEGSVAKDEERAPVAKEKKAALKRLKKPSVAAQLAPQASGEQAYEAGAADFRRIQGEKEGNARSSSKIDAVVPSPRALQARTSPEGRGMVTTPSAYGPKVSNKSEPSLPSTEKGGRGAEEGISSVVSPDATIKEGAKSAPAKVDSVAVKSWDTDVSITAAGFLETAAIEAVRKEDQLKDAPSANASVSRNASMQSLASKGVSATLDISARKNRSVMFPAILSAVSLTGWSIAKIVPHVAGWTTAVAGGTTVQPVQFWHHLIQVGAVAALYAVAAFVAWTALELAVYGIMVRVGRGVTPAEAQAFLIKDAKSNPDLYRGLLGVRPGTGVLKFSFDKQLQPFGVFAFTLSNGIYIRPEMVRMPAWMFRAVVRHELHHFKQDLGRAPPQSRTIVGHAKNFIEEAGATLLELFPRTGRLPQGYLLERVLTQAQVSMRLTGAYDVLVAARETNAIGESDFKWLSEGKARVKTLRALSSDMLAAQTRDALRDKANAGRFRYLLLDDVKGWMPKDQDLKKLEMAFRRMEQVYSERIAQQKAKPLDLKEPKQGASDLWSAVRSPTVEQIELVKFFDDLYRSMQDKGTVLLPFAPGDPDLGPVERMFRHWANADKGYFRTTRVDLAEGGHVLVAVKTEPRVRVYLKPTNGAKVAGSIDSMYRDPIKRAAGEAVLKHIGLEEWLPTFKSIGLEVVHIQGEDVGDTMVYVSVPRKNLRYVQALVEKKQVEMLASQSNFETHGGAGNGLTQAVPRQNAKAAWKEVGGGKGMVIYSDDTGAWAGHPYYEGRVTAEDVTDEGPEDWVGHGTQTMGDALSGGRLKAEAYEATGVMVKVFPKGSGASDGDIRAGWGKAQQGGADVLYMSLGSPGTPDNPLSRDASGLTRRKNSKGEYPVVIASAGNSGPDAETVGQPAAGEEVIALAAATKGENPDDTTKQNALSIALYSSAGFAYSDHGYGLTRAVLKPELTADVGTVNTPNDKGDVYVKGLTSPRSKDAEPAASDSADGLETRAAGTSMAAPQAAGMAAVVKKALKDISDKVEAWVWENLPFSVKMLMMVSAEDMRAPLQKMGAGVMDMGAAVAALRGDLGWIKDARRAVDLPREVFEKAAAAGQTAEGAARTSPEAQLKAKRAARAAAKQVLQVFGKENREKARQVALQTAQLVSEKVLQQEAAASAQKSAQASLKAASADVRSELAALLKHKVWLVRAYAAFAYFSMKDIEALPALAEVAKNDADPRVRQMALQAIAETPSKSVDDQIAPLLNDPTPEARSYAALVLGRHGSPEAVKTLLAQLQDADKQTRYTASWVLGYLGKTAGADVAESLSAMAAKTDEIDSNRHEAIASLGRLVGNTKAMTAKVFSDLLGASGTQDTIVNRTVLNSFLVKAAQDRALSKAMQAEPIRPVLVAFVEKYRSAALKRGGLGDMVRLLARITGVEIGTPAPIDPSGRGVPGVDDNLGPVHLTIEIPVEKLGSLKRTVLAYAGTDAAKASADAEAMNEALSNVAFPRDVVSTLGGNVRSVMKEGFVGIELPAYSVAAFTQQMALKGFLVARSTPKFMYLRDTGPLSGLPKIHESGLTGVGSVGLVIDEGLDTGNPAFADKVLGTVNTSGDGAADDVTAESVGHGTHTGNIAAGSQRPDANPNLGRAPDAFVIAAKVLGAQGGSETTVMEGVSAAMQIVDDVNAKLAAYWKAKDAGQEPALPENAALKRAIGMGIRRFAPALNLSLGGPGAKTSPLNVQLRRLHIDGKAMVNVAAGNDGPGEGTANESSPGNEWSIKSIGALSKKGELEFYSSRATPQDPMRILGHYGGDANLDGAACPFIPGGIVSALAAKISEDVSKCIVPNAGKPTDQAMSGTSMASPHSNGDDLLLLQAMRKIFSDEEFAQNPGLMLWMDELAFSSMAPVPNTKAHEVVGKREIKAELAALEERGKDKAKILAEAAELYKKAKERDGKESAQRWAGVGIAGAARRPIWSLVWQALRQYVAGRPANGIVKEKTVSSARLARARDLAELRGLREVLSTGAGAVSPFVFHTAKGLIDAPAAGLEGYVFAKRRIEATQGADATLTHLTDGFRYLQALLADQPWARELRERLHELELDEKLAASEKNTRLNALLDAAVAALQERAQALNAASWAREARVYELFPRAYNLRDKRLAGSFFTRLRAKFQAPKPFFADVTAADLRQIKELGYDTVWAMGIFPIGQRNRWGSAGGSPYSIADYTSINPELGTLDDYRRFVAAAHRVGLKVIADFVPNHSSMDSKLLTEHPEYFMQIPVTGDPAKPPKDYFRFTQPSTGKDFWIHHGGYEVFGGVESWNDTAQVDYSREDARAAMADAARRFMEATGIDGYRVDMAYLLVNSIFGRTWGKTMPKREFVEQLATELKTAKPSAALIAESYAEQDAVSAAGFDVNYNKTDARREGNIGFYDALRDRNPAVLQAALERVAFLSWQKGGASGLDFTTNHDEASPQRAFGAWMRGALMLTMFLPGAQLLYGSQEIGYDAPGPHEPKSIPFEVARQIDWLHADASTVNFYNAMFRKLARIRKAMPQPRMTTLDGAGRWAGYALSSPESDTVFAVIANPTDAEQEVTIDRPELGIQYRARLAARDAAVVSFPAPSRPMRFGEKIKRALDNLFRRTTGPRAQNR